MKTNGPRRFTSDDIYDLLFYTGIGIWLIVEAWRTHGVTSAVFGVGITIVAFIYLRTENILNQISARNTRVVDPKDLSKLLKDES